MDAEDKDTVSLEEYLALKLELEEKERLIALQSEALDILREKTGGRPGSGGGFPALDLLRPLELIVLAVRRTNVRCRWPGSDWSLTLRPQGRYEIVPGELIAVAPERQWTYRGYPYLTGRVELSRIDANALDLEPLKLRDCGIFQGALRWGHLDNRPFLRCLHGYGLCLWRLGRFEEAEAVFQRGLWLNPADNLGHRFLLPAVRDRILWKDCED